MVNLLPIIGILCIDIDLDFTNYLERNTFFISSSYVKWIESAGASVVPIWADRDEEYYRAIMTKVNGIMFPGGRIYFNDAKYGRAAFSAKKIYDIAVEMNNNGTYFPIWGTCLGFQLFFYAASGGNLGTRAKIRRINANLPLHFDDGHGQKSSKLFRNISDDLLELINTEPVTYNSHFFVVHKETLLTDDWNIVTSSKDSEDKDFLSTSEHVKYPFYGVISHPEKVQFENYPESIPHTRDAVRVSQYFANFFVEEARKNDNEFTGNESLRHLIYNFPITFTEPSLPGYRQIYFFNDESAYPDIPHSASANCPEIIGN